MTDCIGLASKTNGADERTTSTSSPSTTYRQEELARCYQCFFGPDSSYHDARRRFVYKLPARDSADERPARLAI